MSSPDHARILLLPLPGRPMLPLPAYQTDGASGLDLVAAEELVLEPGRWASVGTGLAIELPRGYEAQIRPRSGLARDRGVTVLNAPGTIDADYRGELRVLLINHGPEGYRVSVGDRVAQLVLARVERAVIELVTSLSGSGRGAGGFGHTGR